MSDQCDRGECVFEQRYNTLPPSDVAIETLATLDYANSSQDMEYIELTSQKIYIGEICTVCGRFISPQRSN